MFKFIAVEPLWVMHIHFEKGQEVKPHKHDHYYHMIYVMNGSYNITINGCPYVLSDNMITMAKPGDTQSWCNDNEQPVDTYEIKFAVLDDDFEGSLALLPDIIYGNLFYRSLVEKIIQEKNCLQSEYQEYIAMYLNTLLHDLIRVQTNKTTRPEDDSRGRFSPAQVAAKYIQANYSSDISLDTVAEAINFNKSYLSTAFKQAEGITINEYIYKYRSYKACELIAYSDLQLSEVSIMTGFKHIQHFNRVFKKYIGIPPGEYRNATPRQLIKDDKGNPRYDSDVFAVRAGRMFEVDSESGSFRSKTKD